MSLNLGFGFQEGTKEERIRRVIEVEGRIQKIGIEGGKVTWTEHNRIWKNAF